LPRFGGAFSLRLEFPYNHARYTREKATALTRWADYVLAVVEGRPVTETVVQLRA
jgi:hypothetical protein